MKKYAVVAAVVFLVVLLAVVSGCGKSTPTTVPEPGSMPSTSTTVPNPGTLPSVPQSTSPSSTTPGSSATSPQSSDRTLNGTWVRQGTPSDTIVLSPNHTFVMIKSGVRTSGSYVLPDTTMLFSAGSFTDSFNVSTDNKTLTDKDGTVWTLQGSQ